MVKPPTSPEEYGSAALECKANARALREAAAVLGKSESFGPACALLTISLEELGKAVAFKLCAEGHGRIEGKGKGAKVVLTMPWGPVTIKLHDHPGKRGVAIWLDLILTVIPVLPVVAAALGGWGHSQDWSDKGKAAPKPAASSGVLPEDQIEGPPRAEDIAFLDRQVEEAKKDGELINRLDDLKEAGLYVDFDGGPVSTPAAVDRDTYERATRIMQGYSDMVDRALERGVYSGAVRDLVDAGTDFLKRFVRFVDEKKAGSP
jgi:hypothetical protein